MDKLKLYYPLDTIIVAQKFGENQIPDYKEMGLAGHNGIDFSCPTGTPIYCAHDGEVTYTGIDSKEGYGIIVRTIEQFDYKGGPAFFKTIYWHVKRDGGIAVKTGDKVMIGDLLGYSDCTGLCFGPHLHFGLKPMARGENDWTFYNTEQLNGFLGAIDPEPFFTGQTASSVKIKVGILKKLVELYQKLIILIKGRGGN